MKKLIFLLASLCLIACTHTQSAYPEPSEHQAAGTSQQETTVDSMEQYWIDLPLVAAEENAYLPQLSDHNPEKEALVIIKTNKGNLTVRLFPEFAPLAVENFLTQAKNKEYDGVSLAPSGDNFVIQSGFSKKGSSIWKDVTPSIDAGQGFKVEVSAYLYHLRGALAMANSGPNTTTSSFFINSANTDVSEQIPAYSKHQSIVEAYKKGGNPGLDGSYAVFGQLTDGFTVLDQLATTSEAEPVTITAIEIVTDYSF